MLRSLCFAIALLAAARCTCADSIVVFNEIMYHPATNEPALEWVELHNQMGVNIDLSDWRLSGGIDYRFPSGSIIPGWGYAVIASSPATLAALTGLTNIYGPFDGRLANDGETLRLRNNSDRVLDEVEYNDRGKWPVAPDGAGVSLAKRDEDSASSPAGNWTSSAEYGGTPGAENFPTAPPAPSLRFNECRAGGVTGFWAELINAGAAPAPLSGVTVRVNSYSNSFVFAQPELPPGMFATMADTALGVAPAPGDKLFLFAPGGSNVLDAMVVDDVLRGRTPDGTGSWLYPDVATPGASNSVPLQSDVVINEILYHPRLLRDGTVHESGEEWIELYNRGTATVDLSGWRLRDAVSFDFPPGSLLPADGYLVVARDTNLVRTLYPAAEVTGPYSGVLANRGETVTLEDAQRNPADMVAFFDSHPWPKYADGGGCSLELRDPRSDNASPQAWAASDESAKSSWHTYSYRGVADNATRPDGFHELDLGLLDAGEMLVDDFSVVENPDGAAVQMLQAGVRTCESGTNKWRCIGTHRESTIVPDPDAPGNHVMHIKATGPTDHVHDHIETTFAAGRSVVPGRTYEVSFRARWLAGSEQLHTRLYFNRVPGTTIVAVPATTGTPGARNSRWTANAGPTFSGLAHTPVVPDPGWPVWVRVTPSDPDGISACRLFWSANEGSWSSSSMTPDAHGEYSASFPGYSAGTVVQFYVMAVDGQNVTSYYPAAGSRSGAMFVVQDNKQTAKPVHHLRLVILPSTRNRMFSSPRVMSNYREPGTVIYDEQQVYYDVGVRLKGVSSRKDTLRGFNIRFPADHRFRGVHDTVAIDRSGRVCGWMYGTTNSQEELVVKHIMNRAGDIPSQYDDLIRFIGPDFASPAMLAMGRYGDVFLDSQWPNGSDGTLFKFELIYYATTTVDGNPESLKNAPNTSLQSILQIDVENLGDNPEFYRWHHLISNRQRYDDYSGITNLCKTFSLSGAALDAAVSSAIDEDQWMRMYASHALMCVFDTYNFGGNHNMMFYQRPNDRRMLAFPIDMDWAFEFATFARGTNAPLYGRNNGDGFNLGNVIKLPRNLRRLYGHLDDIIRLSYNRAYMQAWADHYYSLTENHPPFTSTLQFINDRAECVRRKLAQVAPDIPFAVLTPDFVTNVTRVTISGVAPVTIRTIRIAGRPGTLAPSWSTITNWQAAVTLSAGTNRLVVTAYDYRDAPVASNTLTVICTLEFTPPAVVINELLALNSTIITDEFGDFDDWIELYNPAPSNVDVGGLYLSDSPDEPLQFALPAMAMPSQGFLLVWADGETNQGPLHAPFRLNADGEAVLLSVAGPVTSVTLHSLPFGPQHEDISYGLLPDGQTNGPIYMTPTPAASNVEPEPGPLAVVAAVLAIVLRR